MPDKLKAKLLIALGSGLLLCCCSCVAEQSDPVLGSVEYLKRCQNQLAESDIELGMGQEPNPERQAELFKIAQENCINSDGVDCSIAAHISHVEASCIALDACLPIGVRPWVTDVTWINFSENEQHFAWRVYSITEFGESWSTGVAAWIDSRTGQVINCKEGGEVE